MIKSTTLYPDFFQWRKSNDHYDEEHESNAIVDIIADS